ncbi:MAG: DUF2807 domain-containing protein [Phenylobacterium sp.]|uniref:GIN domain-containing protein n=1 Tax=Phenylobacterium sp. TaxID=1871053 RepID=UPI002722CD93|nr:DUF2807 domain-containing protein [Phenylobacterium sp.]MDO8901704.1 DUF2807 domain-containing protein [Phenylobacterium sp.]MDP2214624.1 DUF2807 domain-containing protein [Phenylobacterium sp.]
MARSILALSLAAASLSLAGAAHAASVEVRDAVARVVVTPEARSDIQVDMLTTNPSLPLRVRTQGGQVIIDGDLNRSIRSCRTRGGQPAVTVNGVGEVAYADMPQVVIRTPMDVDIKVGGAVFGAVGRSQSLKIANAGCGDWTIANVTGKLEASQAGSGDMRAGSAGAAVLRVAGSGDVAARQINGPLEVDVAGSGDVKVASVTGPLLQARVAGSGDVAVATGKVDVVSATVAGSGDIRFDGEAGSLKAAIVGSGDVRVRKVSGAVERSVIGSGEIRVEEAS